MVPKIRFDQYFFLRIPRFEFSSETADDDDHVPTAIANEDDDRQVGSTLELQESREHLLHKISSVHPSAILLYSFHNL